MKTPVCSMTAVVLAACLVGAGLTQDDSRALAALPNAAAVYLQADAALDLHLAGLDEFWRTDPWAVDWSAPKQAELVRRLDESQEVIERAVNAQALATCDLEHARAQIGDSGHMQILLRTLATDAARQCRTGDVGAAVRRVTCIYQIGDALGAQPDRSVGVGEGVGSLVAASWISVADNGVNEMLRRDTPLTTGQIDAILGAIFLVSDQDLLHVRGAAWSDAERMADEFSLRWYLTEWLDNGAFLDRVRTILRRGEDDPPLDEEGRRLADWLSDEALARRLERYCQETAFLFRHWDERPEALEALLLERGWRRTIGHRTCGNVECPWAGSFPVPESMRARFRERMGRAWTPEGADEQFRMRFEPLATSVWCTLQMHCQQWQLRDELASIRRRLEEKRRDVMGAQ